MAAKSKKKMNLLLSISRNSSQVPLTVARVSTACSFSLNAISFFACLSQRWAVYSFFTLQILPLSKELYQMISENCKRSLPGCCTINIFLATEKSSNKAFLIWINVNLAEKSILFIKNFHLFRPVKRAFSDDHIADVCLWERGRELV